MQITILTDTNYNIQSSTSIHPNYYKYMYTIFNIKFDIPKQIFFLSYNNDENRDLKKYLSRSSFRLEKQKYFLNKKKNKLILICLTLQNPFK